jgi:uncharacterized protein YcaQ
MPQPLPRKVSNEQARRLFLYLHGLCDSPRTRLTPAALYELIERLGFVQVDSIRTVERAHHLTLFTRNERYRPDLLHTLVENDRHLFENWTHDAAIIPTRWYAYWHHRFASERERFLRTPAWQRRLGSDASDVLERVRRHVRSNGPVMARDLTETREPGVGVWWGWGPSKTALEYLWRTGELAICHRRNFQKVYNLTEHVIPAEYRIYEPSRPEYVDWACRTALQRLGIATPGELAAFWAAITPAEAKAWCEQQSGKTVRVVAVEAADGSKPRQAYARHDITTLLHGLPAPPARVRFLSPFDPVIRDRNRTRRLFNFDYRFEAFVPAPQRQYGYYVLPMLEGDRFIGRIDLKCVRQQRTLEVKGLWLEPGVRRTKRRERLIRAELERYRVFVDADTIHPTDAPEEFTAPHILSYSCKTR